MAPFLEQLQGGKGGELHEVKRLKKSNILVKIKRQECSLMFAPLRFFVFLAATVAGGQVRSFVRKGEP